MLSVAEIHRSLPHRHPMLLVDRVVHLEHDEIATLKAVTLSEPWYREVESGDTEFEYPVALLVESWCQSAALLATSGGTPAAGDVLLLAQVADVSINAPVLPGDVVKHVARLSYAGANTFALTGESRVAEEVVMTVGSVLLVVRPDPFHDRPSNEHEEAPR